MKLGVSFHYLAEEELYEAARYYESAKRGLGMDFLDEAERTIRLILEFPHSAQEIKVGIRRMLMRRFPYGILYSIRERDIRILTIMNLKRRPNYWFGRS